MTSLNQTESKHTLKWILFGILICFIASILFGTFKVLLFEQSVDSRHAVYRQCVKVDEACIQSCHENNSEQKGTCNCCVEYRAFIKPLGERISDIIRQYGIIGVGVGILVGAVLSEYKKKTY